VLRRFIAREGRSKSSVWGLKREVKDMGSNRSDMYFTFGGVKTVRKMRRGFVTTVVAISKGPSPR
jgi:hypothetical protein